jgi:hypothetical protein
MFISEMLCVLAKKYSVNLFILKAPKSLHGSSMLDWNFIWY